MANQYEINTKRFMETYRVVFGKGKGCKDVGMGDSAPFQIIEGGRTEETVNDRDVRIEYVGPKNLPQIVWDMTTPAKAGEEVKPRDNLIRLSDRRKSSK